MKLFFKKIECPPETDVLKEEIEYAKSLTSSKRRDEFLCGRALLRQVAREEYGIDSIGVAYDGKKPRLLNNEFHFSISHSKGFLALAVSDKPVGIDIECIDAKRPYEKIIKRFSKDIQNEFYRIHKNERLKYFFKLWTSYEACIKLKGKMLTARDFNPEECSALFEHKWFEKGVEEKFENDYVMSIATSLLD